MRNEQLVHFLYLLMYNEMPIGHVEALIEKCTDFNAKFICDDERLKSIATTYATQLLEERIPF